MRTYLTTTIFADARRKDRTRKVQAETRSHARSQARAYAKSLWPNAKVAKVTAEHLPTAAQATVTTPEPVVDATPTVIVAAADESRKAAAQAAFKAIVSLQGGRAAARAYGSVMNAGDPVEAAFDAICEAELAAIANS